MRILPSPVESRELEWSSGVLVVQRKYRDRVEAVCRKEESGEIKILKNKIQSLEVDVKELVYV